MRFSFLKEFVTAREEGFTLLELLLVVGVLASVSIGIAELTDNYSQQLRVEKVAKHIKVVHSAAEAYIDDNFAAIEADALANANTITIPIDDDGLGLPYFLKEGGTYLPANYPAQNIYSQTLEVLVLRRSATLLEFMVVSTARTMPIDEMALVANAGGHDVGLVVGSTVGDYNQNDFSGSNAAWTIPVANYGANPWAGANPIPAGEAHLAAFGQVNFNNAVDNFLYRVDIAGTPDANRMVTDLDMGNNTLVNTSEVLADFADVQGNLNALAANVDVGQGFIAEGDVVADSVEVTGTLNLTDMVTNGDVNVNNQATANNLDGNGVDDSGANFAVINAATAGNINTVDVSQFVAQTMNFTGPGSNMLLNDNSEVNANNITGVGNIQAEGMGASILRNMNQMNVNGTYLLAIQGVSLNRVTNTAGPGAVRDVIGNVVMDYDEDTNEGINLDININNRTGGCNTATNGNC